MDILIEVLSTLSLGLLSLLGWALRQFVLSKIDSLKLRNGLTRLADASLGAVRSVAQSYADDLKKANADGKLTLEEKQAARDIALQRMKQLLGEAGMREAQEVFGVYGDGLDKAFVSRIEATLQELK